jgi:hypothetical protein
MRLRQKDFISLEHPKKLKKHHKILIAGGIITLASFLITLVPCKIVETNSSTNLASSTWGLCKLPDPLTNLNSLTYYFYGIYNNPISGLAMQFVIATFISWLVAYLIKKLVKKRKTRKIIDLTKKED